MPPFEFLPTLVPSVPSKVTNRYQIGQFLGAGTFGSVHAAKDVSTGRLHAIKIIPFDKARYAEREAILEEIAILRLVKNDNVIATQDWYEDRMGSRFYIVTELACHGDLGQYLKQYNVNNRMPERLIWIFMAELAAGLSYLHNLTGEAGRTQIIHRDLKVENVLIGNDGELKISDMGHSKRMLGFEKTYTTTVGTEQYTAPEILRGLPYGCSVDVWSLGCILYVMAMRAFPFDRSYTRKSFHVMPGYRPPTYIDSYSASMQRISNSILVLCPEYRPTCDQLLREHVIELGWREVEIGRETRQIAADKLEIAMARLEVADIRAAADAKMDQAEEILRLARESRPIAPLPDRALGKRPASPLANPIEQESNKRSKIDGAAATVMNIAKGAWKLMGDYVANDG